MSVPTLKTEVMKVVMYNLIRIKMIYVLLDENENNSLKRNR